MLALIGGKVYANPFDEPLAGATVLIRDAQIVDVAPDLELPPDCKILDCNECTVVAGLWNSHVHFFERRWTGAHAIPDDELARQLEDFTRYGFTNVFDTGSNWQNTRAIRDRIESGSVRGPRIRSTGEAMLPPNAMPPDDILRVLGSAAFPAPEISNEKQARRATRRLIDSGVDAVKFFGSAHRSDVTITQQMMRAIVEESHTANKPVFIHPSNANDVATALRAGVDVIAHTTPSSGAWDETVLALIRKSGAALTPTLNLWKHVMRHDRISMQEKLTGAAVEQLKSWRDAGADVLFGTDIGAVEYDPAEEYELMSQAGMSFNDILASLTTTPAKRFGDPDREGRIAKNFNADVAVIDGTLSNIRYTIRNGKLLYGRSL